MQILINLGKLMITRNFFVADRGEFRTLSNIYHGIFFKKTMKDFLSVEYFRQKNFLIDVSQDP